MGYLLPFDRSIRRSQDFGANPGWGPNPPGGHNGDDWATPVGTPVRAAGDGVVVFAGEFDDTYADNWGWNLHYGGKMVILNMDGEAGPYFEYGHNSQVLVKAGDRVRRGQVIAITGNTDGGTGVSTGPHCHVGCLPPNFDLGSSTYGRVNPRLYMTEYPDATGALSYASSESIKPLEEDDMFTEQDRAVINSANIRADIARSEATNAKNAALEALTVSAQVSSLIGALAAVSKGEPFDEGKLLAGVKAAAESGVKNAIESITVTVKEGE